MDHKILYAKVKDAIATLPERYQRVIFLRFGIDAKANTLEAIGKQYRITRERVRQIIVKAFFDLLLPKTKHLLAPVFDWVGEKITQEGGVIPEDWFLEIYGKDKKGALLFTLHIGKDFIRSSGDMRFHHRWYINSIVHEKAIKELKNLEDYLGKKSALIPHEEVLQFVSHPNFINISKRILKSSLGGYGLSHWPEVLPKSIKDKAFVVLLKAGRPLHFVEITQRINEFALGKRKALKQTVHNELIKDKRFVLVGRGLYALKSWGYREGTVRDIIYSVLKEKKRPMDKNELIQLVLKERFVQPNTIMLNLQGENIVKLKDGTYTVK